MAEKNSSGAELRSPDRAPSREARDPRASDRFASLSEGAKERIDAIASRIDAGYRDEHERWNQREKFLLDIAKNVEWLDPESAAIILEDILGTWEKTVSLIQKDETAVQKETVAAEDKSVAAEDKSAAVQKDETAVQKDETKDITTGTAKKESERATESVSRLSAELSKTKEAIARTFGGKSAADVVGNDRFASELARREGEQERLWESKNGKKLADLSPEDRASAKKDIAASAEALTIVAFKRELAEKAPPASRAELLSQLSALESATGVPSVSAAVARDPKMGASEYRSVLATDLATRSDVYAESGRYRTVSDGRGLFSSFVPGQGLYVNNDQGLRVRIALAPDDQLRVDAISGSESSDREKLATLKSDRDRDEESRKDALVSSWSVASREWSSAPEGVREGLRRHGIDLDNPGESKALMSRDAIARAKNDPELVKATQSAVLDGANFSPNDFFTGLESLSRTVEQKSSEKNLDRDRAIRETESRLDPKSEKSYRSETEAIYRKAYEASQDNLVFLTQKFGIDAVGQDFLDSVANALRAKGVKFELTKPLDRDGKKALVDALNALMESNPPMYREENGDIRSEPSDPIERRKAIVDALSRRGILKQPGNVPDVSRMGEILAVKPQ